MPPQASAGCSGRRSVTKSRLGGGEEARRPRSLPTRSTSPAPHVKRNNLFILAFKNPALLPVLRGRPAPPPFPPSQARSCPVPPAAPPSSPSSSPRSSSCSPRSPTLLGRGRGGGSEKRFVRLAARLRPGGRGLGGAQRPVALPPPRGRSHPAPACALLLRQRSQPRARRRGGLGFEEERVSESRGGRFSLYKQEA